MALSSSGALLSLPEELYNHLKSIPLTLTPPINAPRPHDLLHRISSGRYTFILFCKSIQDQNSRVRNWIPSSRSTLNALWIKLLMAEWDEWGNYEASRLVLHVANGGSSVEGWRMPGTSGKRGDGEGNERWGVVWEAVKMGVCMMADQETNRYFEKVRQEMVIEAQALPGNNKWDMEIDINYDITPPELCPILPPADYTPSSYPSPYTGADPGYPTHLQYSLHLLYTTESAACAAFYHDIANLSIALANTPNSQLPKGTISESVILQRETRLDKAAIVEMKKRKRVERREKAIINLEEKGLRGEVRRDWGVEMEINKGRDRDKEMVDAMPGMRMDHGRYIGDEAADLSIEAATRGFANMSMDTGGQMVSPQKLRLVGRLAAKEGRRKWNELTKKEKRRRRWEYSEEEIREANREMQRRGVERELRLQAERVEREEREAERKKKGAQEWRLRLRERKRKRERKAEAGGRFDGDVGMGQQGGNQADEGYNSAELHEQPDLDAMLARNIADMKLMCETEADQQTGHTIMDMDTGKKLDKRARSESL